jgi:hypothetical protein
MGNAARKAARLAAVVVVVVGTSAPVAEAARSAAGAAAAQPVLTRVRTGESELRVLIHETMRRSATFRQIVEAIERTNGIVYVARGRCRHGIRACLIQSVVIAGSNRLLRVVIDDRKSDVEVMASLGHELRHAQEVLEDSAVTSRAAMYSFYDRHASTRSGNRFETRAAIDAGDAVRTEVRNHDSR